MKLRKWYLRASLGKKAAACTEATVYIKLISARKITTIHFLFHESFQRQGGEVGVET